MNIDRDKIMLALTLANKQTSADEYITGHIMAAMDALIDQIEGQARQVVITPEIAARSGAMADEWKPIETAPKDGVDILLWDGMSIVIGQWLSVAPWADGETPFGWFPLRNATHWASIPPLPLTNKVEMCKEYLSSIAASRA